MESLTSLGSAVGALLTERKQTLAVAESSAGGLINAALVAVPGASNYYLGGCVIYTATGRETLLGITAGGHGGHALGERAVRAAARAAGARPARHHLGVERNRRERSARQPLRRPRRARLHRGLRPRRGGDHRRHRQRRA